MGVFTVTLPGGEVGRIDDGPGDSRRSTEGVAVAHETGMAGQSQVAQSFFLSSLLVVAIAGGVVGQFVGSGGGTCDWA